MAGMSVKVIKLGSSEITVEMNDGGTVAQAIELSQFDSEGFEISIEGEVVQKNRSVSDGDTIVLAAKIKGG